MVDAVLTVVVLPGSGRLHQTAAVSGSGAHRTSPRCEYACGQRVGPLRVLDDRREGAVVVAGDQRLGDARCGRRRRAAPGRAAPPSSTGSVTTPRTRPAR